MGSGSFDAAEAHRLLQFVGLPDRQLKAGGSCSEPARARFRESGDRTPTRSEQDFVCGGWSGPVADGLRRPRYQVGGVGVAVLLAVTPGVADSYGGSTNSMYSRLNFAVNGQLTLTCVASIGSRIGVVPVSRMTPLATLIVALPMPGSPLAVEPGRRETQLLVICSCGAKANAMLARNGLPMLD